ncbi:PREDICTED: F-box protein At3g47030-like [Camelina sativa]|uniref:F-box protein At3g47030-like n=1 Tax=Camelina sativa TaxID=90675 RepID=A0ABM0TGN4_CAMSA|nr:PREDICTED: F-box protein At3g47030-like [Camelina sativa]
MEKRQKQVVPSPSKSPAREYKKEIPADILIDIVSRLPLKDVARCRCVSKLWSCMLRRRDFTQLYLKVSSVRPRILFTFLYKGKRILYSLPQDLDPDQDYPIVYPHYQMQFPKGLGSSDEVCPSILGFICTKSRKPMICNPSTGQYISLPVTTTKRKQMSRPYFGYDPIGKVFKVLSVSDDYVCRVSTLGTGVVTWKRVECSIPHQPLHTEVCIHGVLYYLAKRMGRGTPPGYMVVCFDVESERFKFLDVELPILGSALINYKGNLGILLPDSGIIYEGTESFELRVLEDTDYEVKWSNNVYILPFYWKYAVSHSFLYIAGMTSAGEIVLSTSFLVEPFEVIYYNIVENTVVRMEISFGFVDKKAPPRSRVLTLVNHVENVELMD